MDKTPEPSLNLALANTLDACIEDALRPHPHPAYPGMDLTQGPDPRIVCLANGLKAIAAALRAKEPTS